MFSFHIYVQDDFLALEIVNRRVRFLWNVGGGTGIVTHPEVIESGDFQDDRFWYRIEAERYIDNQFFCLIFDVLKLLSICHNIRYRNKLIVILYDTFHILSSFTKIQ